MVENKEMGARPSLDKKLNSETFRSFYFLKEELVQFCRENGLPTTGGKEDLNKRIEFFLETGKVEPSTAPVHKPSTKAANLVIDLQTIIEQNFVCSENHRAFFKKHLGNTFSFNVQFQNWLKTNAGRTYQEAIEAYGRILKEKKETRSEIGAQFEYNTYIRDFFADNKGCSLDDAIKCWKFKKSMIGHNRYEKTDLMALKK